MYIDLFQVVELLPSQSKSTLSILYLANSSRIGSLIMTMCRIVHLVRVGVNVYMVIQFCHGNLTSFQLFMIIIIKLPVYHPILECTCGACVCLAVLMITVEKCSHIHVHVHVHIILKCCIFDYIEMTYLSWDTECLMCVFMQVYINV